MVFPGITRISFKDLAKRLYRASVDDAVTDTSAQVSYYFLFSLFPLLFCLVAVAAFFPLEGLVEQALERARPLVPGEAMSVVEGHVRGLLEQRPKLLTFSALTALWTASRGVNAFRKALNLAYDVRESRPAWRTQGTAVLVTVVGLTLTLISLSLFVLGSRFGFWLAERLEIGSTVVWLWSWLRWPVSAAVLMLGVALGFFLLPDVKQKFKYITPGSVLGTALWLAATWAFTQYVERFGRFNVTYGSIGGVVVLLLWLYLSSLVFTLGGEMNAVLEHASEHGKERGARAEGEAPLPASERPSAAPAGMAKTRESKPRLRPFRWRRRPV